MYASHKLVCRKLKALGFTFEDLQTARMRLWDLNDNSDLYYLPRKGWHLRYSITTPTNKRYVTIAPLGCRVRSMFFTQDAKDTLAFFQHQLAAGVNESEYRSKR